MKEMKNEYAYVTVEVNTSVIMNNNRRLDNFSPPLAL
jgi:hypothetical protein